MPNGERRNEVDLRAQMASMNIGDDPVVPSAVAVIPDDIAEFRYHRLPRPNSMIRLLKIKRANFRADPVDFELLDFDLNDTPAYGALSYCWGDGPDDRRMLCNGRLVHGRGNLEQALKRLRAGFAPGQREDFIWADAVCINQRDLDEKSCQILLMERIYSRASTVYVDLGDTQGYTISMGGLNLQFSAMGGMGAQDALTQSDRPDHPLHYKTAFQALIQPWFTRTWIIQELALARRAKFIFAGNVFTQEQLDGILSRDSLRANPQRLAELSSNAVATRGLLNYTKLMQIRAGTMDALKLIQLTRDFQVTNAEDKIFGLFALLSPADREALGPYTRSVPDVYRRFAALQVRQGRAAAMLDSAGLQRQRPDSPAGSELPSWVPDWTTQATGPKVISTLRPTPYSAAGQTQPYFRLVGDASGSGGLLARGMVIDTVNSVALPPSSSLPAAVDRFRAEWERILPTGPPVYRGVSNDEAFARTLLMDDTYTGGNAIAYSSPIVDPGATHRAALAAWRAGHSGGVAAGTRMDPVQTYQMQVGAATAGRAFATTSKRRIGLVPLHAAYGDLIVLLHGVSVPFVIRWTERGYVLVGDAYVHGVMNGEEVGKWEVDDITLV
jgi:hypothetical protein